MMNERGKSDKPILPEKSPNKAGTAAAEGMEERGLVEGNLRQQNAFRTQGREDVRSALERVPVWFSLGDCRRGKREQEGTTPQSGLGSLPARPMRAREGGFSFQTMGRL